MLNITKCVKKVVKTLKILVIQNSFCLKLHGLVFKNKNFHFLCKKYKVQTIFTRLLKTKWLQLTWLGWLSGQGWCFNLKHTITRGHEELWRWSLKFWIGWIHFVGEDLLRQKNNQLHHSNNRKIKSRVIISTSDWHTVNQTLDQM